MENRQECYNCNFKGKCNHYVAYNSEYCKRHKNKKLGGKDKNVRNG